MSDRIGNLLRKVGVRVYRYRGHTSTGTRLKRLLDFFHIDLVLDAGADSGHYAAELRANGYADGSFPSSGRHLLMRVLRLPQAETWNGLLRLAWQ